MKEKALLGEERERILRWILGYQMAGISYEIIIWYQGGILGCLDIRSAGIGRKGFGGIEGEGFAGRECKGSKGMDLALAATDLR